MAGGAWDTGEWDSAYWDSLPMTGNSSTGGIGSLGASKAVSLSADASNGQVGTTTANVTIAILGVLANGASGSVSSEASQAISGVQANGAVSSVVQDVTLLLAGISAVGAVGTMIAPAQPEIFLGGHFGFDERDKAWEQDKKQEAKRREKIKTALFGLPPEEREKITSAPTQTIEIAAQTVITYDALMAQIETLKKRIEFEQDEEDFETLLEFL
jgi:hypothetical protein